MGQLVKRRRAASAVFAGMLLAALATGCTPIRSSNGYIPDPELVAKVRPGVHDKESVAQLLGSPTSVSEFGPETWFYVKREANRLAFLPEDVTEQTVIAVKFNKAGIVSGIKRYDLKDGRDIEPVDRVTPTRGKELTVIEQLFGNIGRFSDSDSPTK